jgi:hypothetical protein
MVQKDSRVALRVECRLGTYIGDLHDAKLGKSRSFCALNDLVPRFKVFSVRLTLVCYEVPP